MMCWFYFILSDFIIYYFSPSNFSAFVLVCIGCFCSVYITGSSPLPGISFDADTATPDKVNSLAASHDEVVQNSKTLSETDDIKNYSVSNGIYMESSGKDVMPLDPLKAEKLATFGKYVIVALSHLYYPVMLIDTKNEKS